MFWFNCCNHVYSYELFFNKLYSSFEKAKCLNKFINSQIGIDITSSYKRASNILESEIKNSEIEIDNTTDPGIFKSDFSRVFEHWAECSLFGVKWKRRAPKFHIESRSNHNLILNMGPFSLKKGNHPFPSFTKGGSLIHICGTRTTQISQPPSWVTHPPEKIIP